MFTKESRMLGAQCDVFCPHCGCEECHHQEVEVFERLGGEDGYSYSIKPGSEKRVLRDDNPSKRRNAVRIHFWGECGHWFYIDFVQHKGLTYVQHSNDKNYKR